MNKNMIRKTLSGLRCCKSRACYECPYNGCEHCWNLLIDDAAEVITELREEVRNGGSR